MERDTRPMEKPPERAPDRNAQGDGGGERPGNGDGTVDLNPGDRAQEQKTRSNRTTLLMVVAAIVAWATIQSVYDPTGYGGAVWLLTAMIFHKRFEGSKYPRKWATDAMLGTAMGLTIGEAVRYWV